MGWAKVLTELDWQREHFDRRVDSFYALAERYHARIYCEKGCCNCCTLTVNCSFPEALAISQTLTAVQHQAVAKKLPELRQISRQAQTLTEFLRRFRELLGGCPFLNHADGCCNIYPLRPFSCRALLSTRNSSWCAVDFANLHPLEQEAFLSSLDQELVAFPSHYLKVSQELGLERETQAVAAMRASFGSGLSGNLIYQVWLEQEHRLSAVIEEGAAAIRSYLEERQLNLPFLLQVEED